MLTRFLTSAVAVPALVAVTASASVAQTAPRQFTGQLSPELVESLAGISPRILVPLKPEAASKLPAPLKPDEAAFIGGIPFYERVDSAQLKLVKTIPLLLIESPAGQALYVNLRDDSSAFRANERYVFVERKPGQSGIRVAPGDKDLTFMAPLPAGSFVKAMPYHVFISPTRDEDFRKFRGANGTKERYVWLSTQVAQGTMEIDGKKTLVQYDVDPINGKIRDIGYYAVDANGDGTIEPRSKAERTYRKEANDPLVFRIGDVYVAPRTVDNATGTFVMEERSASDYSFIELAVGVQVPDFSFVDMTGAKRQFSEFRGKYVLLDFWGTWCGPCRAEIPHLKEAYKQFKGRGFEILGFDKDDDFDAVKAFLAKNEITWMQASTAMPEHGPELSKLMSDRLRVTGYPTTILVDPQGKVVSMSGKDEPPLRGTGLHETLDKLLPPAASASN